MLCPKAVGNAARARAAAKGEKVANRSGQVEQEREERRREKLEEPSLVAVLGIKVQRGEVLKARVRDRTEMDSCA
jgi:hypothetical protein